MPVRPQSRYGGASVGRKITADTQVSKLNIGDIGHLAEDAGSMAGRILRPNKAPAASGLMDAAGNSIPSSTPKPPNPIKQGLSSVGNKVQSAGNALGKTPVGQAVSNWSTPTKVSIGIGGGVIGGMLVPTGGNNNNVNKTDYVFDAQARRQRHYGQTSGALGAAGAYQMYRGARGFSDGQGGRRGGVKVTTNSRSSALPLRHPLVQAPTPAPAAAATPPPSTAGPHTPGITGSGNATTPNGGKARPQTKTKVGPQMHSRKVSREMKISHADLGRIGVGALAGGAAIGIARRGRKTEQRWN
jgi:hypothetical protein